MLIECVPNFSEGRDASVVDALVQAVSEVKAVSLLDRESDRDHNRSVLTFAGPPEAVLEAAVAAVGVAAQRIDLTRHRGVHPRMGAADVLPFIPLDGATMDDCAALAVRAGEAIWQRFGVPVYLYGAAARHPGRKRLEQVRRGQFEKLREAAVSDPAKRPDIGGPALHPTAGAVAVGARKVLLAYNINLATNNVDIAKRIARKIRESSGGLPCVKAMGVMLASRGLAQVSMNLTDYERTPLHVVFDAVEREARAEGVGIAESEIIGLAPVAALEQAAAHYLRVRGFRPTMVLERRLAAAR